MNEINNIPACSVRQNIQNMEKNITLTAHTFIVHMQERNFVLLVPSCQLHFGIWYNAQCFDNQIKNEKKNEI